jgi:serine/threonine protein kinase
MNERTIDKAPLESASVTGRIDILCDQFESSWKAGQQPRIEDLLAHVPQAEHGQLIEELLLVEVGQRRRGGETVDPQPYRERFPPFLPQVESAFSRADRVTEPNDPGDSEQPKTLGEYELLAKLGEGGMGTVYKARQVRLDKIVALKLLPRDRTGDPLAVTRFEREMKAVGRLSHPNIVQAYDARDIEGTTVLVMEYVEGCDLSQLVRRVGPLPVADACELVRQAALGLQYAHEHGMVHRDIKPSNLMLSLPSRACGRRAGGEDSSAVVKILDLGLALLNTESAVGGGEMTSTGQAMGTADYMAPEQATDSHRVDIRADIYSLGCTLYKLLTGRLPFTGPQYDTAMKKMLAHVQTPPPAANSLRPEIPDELVAALERMMAKDPVDRFQVPAEVAEAMAPLCSGANLAGLFALADLPAYSITVTPPGPQPRRRSRGSTWLARRRVLIAAALGVAILAAGVTIWTLMSTPKSPEVVVQQATLFVRRNGDDHNIEKLTLTDRHDENELSLRPLGPKDDFKFHADFNRSTYWCLVWLDTNGAAQIAARSECPEKVVEYPPGNQLVGVDPHDPAGIHLLLLLASNVPPSEIVGDLEHRLAHIGRPPRIVLGKTAPLGVTRGAGSVQTTTANLDPAYFQRVEEQLPSTVRWVHQLYLPTQR